MLFCCGGGGGADTRYRILAGAQGLSGMARMSIRILENILEVCRWHREKLNLNEAILCWGGAGGADTVCRILAGAQDLSRKADMSIRMLVNTLEVCRWHRKKLTLNDAI